MDGISKKKIKKTIGIVLLYLFLPVVFGIISVSTSYHEAVNLGQEFLKGVASGIIADIAITIIVIFIFVLFWLLGDIADDK